MQINDNYCFFVWGGFFIFFFFIINDFCCVILTQNGQNNGVCVFTGQRRRGFLPHLGHLHGHAAADGPGGWKKPAFQRHSGEPCFAPRTDSRLGRRWCYGDVYFCMYPNLPHGVSRNEFQIFACACASLQRPRPAGCLRASQINSLRPWPKNRWLATFTTMELQLRYTPPHTHTHILTKNKSQY